MKRRSGGPGGLDTRTAYTPIPDDRPMPTLTARTIEDLSRTLLQAADVPADEAATVAEHLADANLVGHDSHGIQRVPEYVQRIRDGIYLPAAPFDLISQTSTTGVYDGGWGLGQVQAGRALDELLAKARQHGCATVGLRKVGHIGRLGFYVQRAAEAGMLAMCSVNGHNVIQTVAPWGGVQRRLGTNPIAYGAPSGMGFAIVYDVATSAAAEGKVRLYHKQGKPIADDWVIDKDGNRTTDPGAYYDGGALLPFGGLAGHKGFGLGFIVEVMTSALAGTGQVDTPTWRFGCNGVYMTAVHIEAMMPLSRFCDDVDRLIGHVKSSRKAPGVDQILVPGEFEAQTRSARTREGVHIDPETWRQLDECGQALGVKLDTFAQQADMAG